MTGKKLLIYTMFLSHQTERTNILEVLPIWHVLISSTRLCSRKPDCLIACINQKELERAVFIWKNGPQRYGYKAQTYCQCQEKCRWNGVPSCNANDDI
jgi:hypothetical protein